ncbi:MAG: transposase family protein, partial [Chloroflexota bacterium]|nr:transposase family protein [Chloroflexota bacterium]
MSTPSELASECMPDTDTQQQEELLKSLLVTVQHFFGGFSQLFQPVTEPRNPRYITYPLAALGTVGVLMFLFRLGARRQINAWLRGNGPSAAKFQALFAVETCPHGDTLNAAFKQLDPQQLQEVVSGMLKTLIRKKVLYPYRLLDRYFVIAIDGTGRLTFPVRHCPHCLTATHHGQTIYYHPVLEAKAVFPNGFVFSIMTEFIENPEEQPRKQDCELQAFYRLAKRLHQAFPRLPICLSMDALFAGGPTLTICEQYDWKYLIVLQEGSIPYVNEEFQALLPLEPQNHLQFHTGPQHKIRQDYRWINDIAYVDSKDAQHTVAVLECLENKPAADGPSQTTRFKWITNFTVKS